MAEITLIDARTSQQVITEVERNLADKLPHTLPFFRLLTSRCLHVVPDPSRDDIVLYEGLADEKDLPILVAAVQGECPWLVTFNERHFRPGHPAVTVLRPGALVQQIRQLLSSM